MYRDALIFEKLKSFTGIYSFTGIEKELKIIQKAKKRNVKGKSHTDLENNKGNSIKMFNTA